VGAVPPFGHRERIQLLVDVGVYNNTESSFNIGLRTHSARVATADVKKILDKLALCVGDFTKE
jgi:prolyl-tRNA editing enzyme YbaK/EbsC (Cys-tRNA(Pro) deacylase)